MHFLPFYLKNNASEFYCEMPQFQTGLRVFLVPESGVQGIEFFMTDLSPIKWEICDIFII